MCLSRLKNKDGELRFNTVPYNTKLIRWKLIDKSSTGEFIGPFQYTPYKKKGWNYAKFDTEAFQPSSHGFHVFVNQQAAVANRGTSQEAKKIEVRGFLTAGKWGDAKSETWCAFKFID